MGRFSEKMRRFLLGRYGADALYYTLFWSGFVFLLAGILLGMFLSGTMGTVLYIVFSAVGVVLYVLALCRAFSRNIPARTREKYRFARLCNAVARPFRLFGCRLRDRKTHIYRKCPGCKKTLRLPKVRGEHTVNCPQCHCKFRIKVK